jgi:hypothetical protein
VAGPDAEVKPPEWLLLYPCHPLKGSHLSEESSFWLSREPNDFLTWRHVPHNASLCSDPSAAANPDMSIQGGLPSDLDEVLDDGRTRNAGLANDHATPAEHNVVSDLHKIIETRAGADHRVSHRSSINRRIGANLYIVFENHPPKLGGR